MTTITINGRDVGLASIQTLRAAGVDTNRLQHALSRRFDSVTTTTSPKPIFSQKIEPSGRWP